MDFTKKSIDNLYDRIPEHFFLRTFTPNHYLVRLFWNSKVRTVMFLDVKSQKDWILSVVEENTFTNRKPFWIRNKQRSVRENSGNSTKMSSAFWTTIFLMSLKLGLE